MQESFEQPWFPWALGIAVGLPVLTLLLGEIVVRLQRRSNPLAGPINIVRLFILPAAAVILLFTQVAPRPNEDVVVKILTTILWMAVIIAALSFANVLLFESAAKSSWRSRLPRIFVDLGRLLLIGLGAALVYAWVWGRNVSYLLTAIGFSSLVIGLALQNSVGPIISGLLLLFERPFALGDWLKVGDVTGEVVEVNWRATHLDTGNQLQVIPNGVLAASSFANFSRPALMHNETVTLKFTLKDPPNRVKELLEDAAAQVKELVPGNKAEVLIAGIDGDTVSYAATLKLQRQTDGPRARDEYLTLAYYAARREGMTMVGMAPYLVPDDEQLQVALRLVAPLLRLSEADLERLAPQARLQQFARGEVLLRQGEHSRGLNVLLSGRAHVVVDEPQRGRLHLFDLEPNDFFGEDALTGETSAVTVLAMKDVVVLLLESEQLQALLDDIPRLAQDLGETMDHRRRMLNSTLGTRRLRATPNGRSANKRE